VRRFGIAGAGFAGSVIAREVAEAGHEVVVFETRDHVAGNCHTERDPETGVMVHRYGPHIFHTGDERVWAYLNRFATMMPYHHRVRTTVGGRVYPLPVNLLTINQLFQTSLRPQEARVFVAAEADSSIAEPSNFEEWALKSMGRRLYEAFFLGYTRKQWGLEPTELPVSVLKRLPLRFDYDDSYFDHPHQGIPREGYTAVVEAILDHPRIDVRLSSRYSEADRVHFDHSIWTGPLDEWFGFRFGRLAYRTLDFEVIRSRGDYLGCAVMNFGDLDVPYTRISEHKHFAPWEDHEATVCFKETSRPAGETDIPFYPIRLARDKALLGRYLESARAEAGVTFVGRLGTYRYLDMDVTIGEALTAAERILRSIAAGSRIPSLVGPG
jgi:UDP-galactopyranose mutase